MPVAESLCCGTAVVGFKAGAPEEITIPEYSKFVSHGDVDALEKATRIFLEKNFQESEISQKASKKYAKETMFKGYVETYEN